VTFQKWWDANGKEFPRMAGAMSPRDLARDCWKAAQEQVPKTEIIKAENERLRAALERYVAHGEGCISPPPNCPDDWLGYGSFHCVWCGAKAALGGKPGAK
jgi:hypothetical protein